MTRWVWLGLRLSVGSGRQGLLRTVLMSSGAALGSLIVLACLGTLSVAAAQHDRAEARNPVYLSLDENGEAPAAAPGALRIVEIDDAIGTRPLRRVAVGGATPDGPRPPGIAALPGPGEAIVSPALAELIRTDERAKDRFPQRITGTIGSAGLVAPDELYAYVGVPAGDPALALARPAVTGFGAPLEWYAYGGTTTGPDVFSDARGAAMAFALFVLVPFGVFLATCARLSASTRDRRIAALRLLGITGRQAALVNAIETGVVAAGGAVGGTALFALLAPVSQGWQIGRLHWYAADIGVPAALVVTVLAATVGYAVLVGVLAARPARIDPLGVRRQAPAGRPRTLRLAVLAAGLGSAALAGTWTSADPDTRGWLLAAGVLLTGLGLALALPVLGYAAAGLTQRLPRTPVWLDLATARLRHSPGVAPRLVASIAVAVYVAGVGSLATTLVFGDVEASQSRESGDDALYNLATTDPALMADVRRLPGVELIDVRGMPMTIDGAQAYAVVADCADFTGMFRLGSGESCVDGRVYRLEGAAFEPAPAGPFTAVTEDGVRIPVPDATLHPEARHNLAQSGALLVTRRSPFLAGVSLPDGNPMLVARDLAAVEPVLRLISARAPAGHLDGELGTHRGLDLNMVMTILIAGLTVSVGLGIASFAAAAIDRTVERRRDNATLAVVGVRPAVTTACEVGSGALPLAIGLVLAAGSTVAVAASLAGFLELDVDRVLDRIAPVLWLSLGALVVGLVLIAVPAHLFQRITAEELRRP